MNIEQRRQRKADIAKRAKAIDHMNTYCRIFGCGNPTTAHTNSGLNRMYCRKHADHFERHGSYTKGSYRAADLAPHRKSAIDWLKANKDVQVCVQNDCP